MFLAGIALLFIEPFFILIMKVYMHVPTRLVFSKHELLQAWGQHAVSLLVYGTVWFQHGVLSAMVPWAIYGGLFYIFTQISHVNDPSMDHNQKGGASEEWAVVQVRSCRGDFAVDSW